MSPAINANDDEQPDCPDSTRTPQLMHLLPCKILPHALNDDQQTFSAPVTQYFCPYTVPTSDGENDTAVWHASFRGRPLTGVQLDMPDGYVGILYNRKVNPTDSAATIKLPADDANSEVIQQMMYWNWDRVPTREDPFLAAYDWIRISEAMA